MDTGFTTFQFPPHSALAGVVSFSEPNQLWLLVALLLDHSAQAGVTFTRKRHARQPHDGMGMADEQQEDTLSTEELHAAYWHHGKKQYPKALCLA